MGQGKPLGNFDKANGSLDEVTLNNTVIWQRWNLKFPRREQDRGRGRGELPGLSACPVVEPTCAWLHGIC